MSLSPNGYLFWLIVVAVVCFAVERTLPSRTERPILRHGVGQDLVWLLFNGAWIAAVIALPPKQALPLFSQVPLLVQLVLVAVVKDFLDWCAHNLLHRVPWLWELHKVHHSLEELDTIGSFRFHWIELIFSGGIYLLLAALGADQRVLLVCAVFSAFVVHLSHSNLRLDWGPLRYIVCSPQFHAWHHRRILRGERGANYAVVLCIWDWLFGTVHLGAEGMEPDALGFEGDDYFPQSLLERFTYPLSRWLGRSS